MMLFIVDGRADAIRLFPPRSAIEGLTWHFPGCSMATIPNPVWSALKMTTRRKTMSHLNSATRLSLILAIACVFPAILAAATEGGPEILPVSASYAHSEAEEGGPATSRPELVRTIAATSTLGPGKTARYDAINLLDGDRNTAWVEGRQGDGVGERLIMLMRPNAIIKGILVENGYAASADLWRKNSRVKELSFEVVFSDGSMGQGGVLLSDSDQAQFFFLGFKKSDSLAVGEITFTIISVYPGTKYDDSCLATLSPY